MQLDTIKESSIFIKKENSYLIPQAKLESDNIKIIGQEISIVENNNELQYALKQY